MAGIQIKDYKIHNLQTEYKFFSLYFINLQYHINKCHNNNIITLNDKNSYFKNINDLLKQLNNEYNNVMLEICEEDNNKENEITYLSEVFPLANLSNINGDLYDEIKYLVNLCKSMKIDTSDNNNKILIEELLTDPFTLIKKELLEMCKKVGFYNINDGLNMIISEHYEKLYDKNINSYIKILKNTFVCIGYDCVKLKKPQDPTIYIKKTKPLNESLISNCIKVHISRVDNNLEEIVLYGYMDYDSLNIMIRTSQICNNFIYKKKKKFEK